MSRHRRPFADQMAPSYFLQNDSEEGSCRYPAVSLYFRVKWRRTRIQSVVPLRRDRLGTGLPPPLLQVATSGDNLRPRRGKHSLR